MLLCIHRLKNLLSHKGCWRGVLNGAIYPSMCVVSIDGEGGGGDDSDTSFLENIRNCIFFCVYEYFLSIFVVFSRCVQAGIDYTIPPSPFCMHRS